MTPPRIVIVEDQREVSRLLRTSLETLENELEVVEIPTGEEALIDASKNKLDLLISDYRLPGISGIDLMQQVSEFHPGLKVILITGLSDPKVRKEVAEAGAHAFFIKPVPIADFLDAVERGLGLVDTFLPAEPISPLEEEQRASLPDTLAQLRQELKAGAVMLLNDDGRIIARAGDLPEQNMEVVLISSLLSIHSAGLKVSRILGQKRISSWHIFDDGDFNLVFSPVGHDHGVMVIGKKISDEKNLPKVISTFSTFLGTIEQALGKLPEKKGEGTAVNEPLATPSDVVEESVKEMEPLLKDAKKKIKPGEADEFWDNVADKHKAPAKPDMLSYDQAKQLGLAPKEE